MSTIDLCDRDREILEFERIRWQYAAAKETAVREKFDMSGVRYYQVLDWLIDQPCAMAYDAQLVKRLQRLRASRQRARRSRSADNPSGGVGVSGA